MNEFEYYFIRSKYDAAYPSICITDRDDEENPTLISIEFNDPKPRKPVMADFLSGPEIFITQKIVDVIKKFNPDNVKCVKTELTDPKGNISSDYYCLLADNDIEAMDKEKSIFRKPRRIYFIEKFVLDREALREIPLDKRLIFVLDESAEKVLFHKSVADAIMAVDPTGMEFIDIEKCGGF